MRRVAVSLIAAGVLFAAHATACSCAGGLRTCPAPTANTIAVATVLSIENVRRVPPASAAESGQLQPASRTRSEGQDRAPQPWGSLIVTLSVSEALRGDSGPRLVVRTENGEESCGYPFEVGHEYLVFVNEFQGQSIVSFCSATRPARTAPALIRQLRSIRDSSPLPALFGFVVTRPPQLEFRGREQVQPMAGAVVTAKSAQGEYVTRTVEDGSYEFSTLPIGAYQITLEPPPGSTASWGKGKTTTRAFVSQGNHCPVNLEVFNE